MLTFCNIKKSILFNKKRSDIVPPLSGLHSKNLHLVEIYRPQTFKWYSYPYPTLSIDPENVQLMTQVALL